MRKKSIAVDDDLMQKGYVYFLTEPTGRNFHPDFHPQLSPSEMLNLGVFGGRYMTDCANEFPASVKTEKATAMPSQMRRESFMSSSL